MADDRRHTEDETGETQHEKHTQSQKIEARGIDVEETYANEVMATEKEEMRKQINDTSARPQTELRFSRFTIETPKW